MSAGALFGMKILDLSRVLAGPYCTMILGDLGAEVIKIEAPGGSDDTREWGPPYLNNISAYYLCTNRNKQSLTLNLKSEKGRGILKSLVKTSDVLIHNFKTGAMEDWGLDYETLSEINSKLVYCNISGFGKTGPYNHEPGYDFVIQAMSGLMSITGSDHSGPMKVGVAITDVLTGLYATIAIQAALLERHHSGRGQEIDISLFESAIASLVNVGSNYLVSGKVPERLGNYHPNIVPYQTFPTSDGEMVIAVGNDRQFRSMCLVLGVKELAEDERFKTNASRVAYRESLEKLLALPLRKHPCHYWTSKLLSAGVPCGPINNIDVAFNDPQVKARKLLQKMDHPTAGIVPFVGSPIHLSRSKVTYTKYPPEAGEHTEAILSKHGFTKEEIQKLKNLKII